MPRILSNITVTQFDKKLNRVVTTDVSTSKLYDGRSSAEIEAAEHWAKGVCDRIYGKQKAA